ncbi:MAG: ThuA domain-containing protein [Clostridiales bacterium]|nr:ThuA domain-containing protein [Clostridiales bacterium]
MADCNATIFVSPMGHDVDRVSALMRLWLEGAGLSRVDIAGCGRHARESIERFMNDDGRVRNTDLFIFVCSDEGWEGKLARSRLEQAVASGTPIMFSHGLHPCFRDWPEVEKMIGLLWRDTAQHGDFNSCAVRMESAPHPITCGVSDFETADELFCGLENVHGVPLQVLASAYSSSERLSRWGHRGTGNWEPVLTTGQYGKGRTVNFLLGHVWRFYTGHGLMENTMIAFEPPAIKTLFLRCCEWALTGRVRAAGGGITDAL